MTDESALLRRLDLGDEEWGLFRPGLAVEAEPRGGGPTITSVNPTTGTPIGRIRAASPADLAAALDQVEPCFESWRRRPAPARGALVRDLGVVLRQHRDDLGALIALEMGKIRAEGIGEVQEMIDICDFAVGLSRQLHGLTIASERPNHRMFEQWHPLGPVAIVSAFNFPMAVWSWNAAIAAVCGDVCLWKPSPHAPLCAIAVQKLCEKVMADHDARGVFNLMVGDAEVSRAMAAEARLPLVSFTGSTAAGRQVAATVASRLGRSLLELGGNNAIIVLDDADLELAVRALVFGAVGTAGQRCTTTRRVYAQRGIANGLLERLRSAYGSIAVGDPLAEGTLMGPLIDASAVARFETAVAAAVGEGGEVVCGGRPKGGSGFFVEPTIIRAHGPLSVAADETFAPILYFFEVDDLDQAIAANNDVAHGLSSAIFTDSVRSAEAFLSATGSDCGIANVNIGTSGAEIGGAFGGEKDTGGGREAGSDAWKSYMRRQTCTINYGRELPLAQGIHFG